MPPNERVINSGNTFTRSGGPAVNLIGIQDSRIENNVIDSPVRATLLARPNDEADRQAILLRHSSRVLGLDATKEIALDGEKLPDASARMKSPSKG